MLTMLPHHFSVFLFFEIFSEYKRMLPHHFRTFFLVPRDGPNISSPAPSVKLSMDAQLFQPQLQWLQLPEDFSLQLHC